MLYLQLQCHITATLHLDIPRTRFKICIQLRESFSYLYHLNKNLDSFPKIAFGQNIFPGFWSRIGFTCISDNFVAGFLMSFGTRSGRDCYWTDLRTLVWSSYFGPNMSDLFRGRMVKVRNSHFVRLEFFLSDAFRKLSEMHSKRLFNEISKKVLSSLFISIEVNKTFFLKSSKISFRFENTGWICGELCYSNSDHNVCLGFISACFDNGDWNL